MTGRCLCQLRQVHGESRSTTWKQKREPNMWEGGTRSMPAAGGITNGRRQVRHDTPDTTRHVVTFYFTPQLPIGQLHSFFMWSAIRRRVSGFYTDLEALGIRKTGDIINDEQGCNATCNTTRKPRRRAALAWRGSQAIECRQHADMQGESQPGSVNESPGPGTTAVEQARRAHAHQHTTPRRPSTTSCPPTSLYSAPYTRTTR